MDTPATNDTGMVMCNRELVRDYLAAYVCDILGDVLQIVGQASVDIAAHTMTMLANQLIPAKQPIPVDAYGIYEAAKEYIDYNIDVFMDDTALTDKEYRLIWKETVKHYCRMHDLYTDHWYDFCEDLHECIMNAE